MLIEGKLPATNTTAVKTVAIITRGEIVGLKKLFENIFILKFGLYFIRLDLMKYSFIKNKKIVQIKTIKPAFSNPE